MLGIDVSFTTPRPLLVVAKRVSDVQAINTGSASSGGRLAGWEPCFYTGTVASDYLRRTQWISAQAIARFYLITIEGSEPLLISVGGPAGSEWFDEVESTVIATLQLGPDAPPFD